MTQDRKVSCQSRHNGAKMFTKMPHLNILTICLFSNECHIHATAVSIIQDLFRGEKLGLGAPHFY